MFRTIKTCKKKMDSDFEVVRSCFLKEELTTLEAKLCSSLVGRVVPSVEVINLLFNKPALLLKTENNQYFKGEQAANLLQSLWTITTTTQESKELKEENRIVGTLDIAHGAFGKWSVDIPSSVSEPRELYPGCWLEHVFVTDENVPYLILKFTKPNLNSHRKKLTQDLESACITKDIEKLSKLLVLKKIFDDMEKYEPVASFYMLQKYYSSKFVDMSFFHK